MNCPDIRIARLLHQAIATLKNPTCLFNALQVFRDDGAFFRYQAHA